jgi:hypothetical protein
VETLKYEWKTKNSNLAKKSRELLFCDGKFYLKKILTEWNFASDFM